MAVSPSLAPILLRLAHISKTFSGKGAARAVNDITLAFTEGEFVTILGPSGCGKTTLLKLIAGIDTPDEGKILLDGKDVSQLPPEHRQFGMVFQNYALFPNLTVLGNVMYGLHTPEWKSTAKERAQDLLALVGLGDMEKRYPLELSGGQQQRVALARALAPRPRVLLLDEPLSALDAQVRLALGQELLRIQRTTGITTIMVTHDQQEALALADRIILMHQGQVEQAGTPEELYANPVNRFAAEFVGHMNILSLPEMRQSEPVGIRYEDVRIARPSEQVLQTPYTWVGRVEHIALMGAFYRLKILLNNFTTYVYADVPRPQAGTDIVQDSLVAVTLPHESWRILPSDAPQFSSL